MALEEPQADDVLVQEGGARVLLEGKLVKWFGGAELNWETGPWGGGFTFNHPDLRSC